MADLRTAPKSCMGTPLPSVLPLVGNDIQLENVVLSFRFVLVCSVSADFREHAAFIFVIYRAVKGPSPSKRPHGFDRIRECCGALHRNVTLS